MHDADSLHTRFNSIDAGQLDAMIDRGEPEGLQLEAKKLTSTAGKLTPDDQKRIAKAISAFANAAGGILLLGVDTARTKGDQTSRFQSLSPVGHGDSLLSQLTESVGQLTQRPVNDLKVERIDVQGGSVFKLLIPESDSTPHRAESGDRKYYRRWADKSLPMEHHEIEDMFGRRRRPLLSLEMLGFGDFDYRHSDGTANVPILIGIRNRGRGIARFPLAEIVVAPDTDYRIDVLGLDKARNHGLPLAPRRRTKEAPFVFSGGSSVVIHPDQTLELTHVEALYKWSESRPRENAKIIWKLYADGVPVRQDTLRIDREQVEDLVRERRRPSV